jgi:DNA-binding transcriptional LysR family regulator
MNLQQLRILGEALRRDLNLTEVAKALNTSQSGVSKHIMDLERELGVDIFVRRGKRIVGLTEPGKELSGLVGRILLARISHTAEAHRGANQRKLFCDNDFPLIQGASRCRRSVAQNGLILEWWKAGQWKRPLMLGW